MYYIATEHPDWNFADFLESGEQLVATRVDPFVRRMNVTPSNSMAVDIGAGLGRASRALSNRFAHVTGVDISSVMVTGAQSLNADQKNLDFIVNHGNDLPGIARGTYHLVFSAFVFQHISTMSTILDYVAEVSRVLVKNGLFIIQAYCAPWPTPWVILHNRFVGTAPYELLLRRFRGADRTASKAFPGILLSASRLAEICEANGLALLDIVTLGEPDGSYWAYGKRR
jgi:ubiquinone/menaquinone biosynthesis C-methylase UbiE